MRKELTDLAQRLKSTLDAAPEAAAEPTEAPKKKSKEAARPMIGYTPPKSSEPIVVVDRGQHDPKLIKWEIAPRVRADLLAYAGLHCGGQMTLIRVMPDQRNQGDLDGAEFKSLMLVGPIGTRMTLATSGAPNWQDYPWRSIVITEGNCFIARNGKHAVKVLDLDFLDDINASRASDNQAPFPAVETREEGKTWTYGRRGELKNKVRVIMVDKVDLD